MLASLLTIVFTFFGYTSSIDSLQLPHQDSTILVDSVKSKYVEIDNIFIIGNRKTKERIILREMSIEKGQMIYLPDLQEHLENDRNKILNTRLFIDVQLNVLELSPDKVDIVIRVDERWYTFPVPIFELVDRNFVDWWVNRNHDFNRVRYGIRFYQFNMRGNNEKLRLLAQFGITRRFGILYSIPYIDQGQHHGLQLQVNYKENINQAYKTENHRQLVHNSEDLLYQQLNAEIKYTYRSEFYNFHEVRAIYEGSRISDTINILNPNFFNNQLKEQQAMSLVYSFRRDKRDFVSYPLRGHLTEVTVEKKGLGIFKDVNLFSIDASYSRFFDLGKKFYLSNFTNVYFSTPNTQPYSNYKALGYGSKLVRGYEAYVVEGSSYFLNKTSFKKLLWEGKINLFSFLPRQFNTVPFAIYAKTFFDFGYVNNYPDYELNTRLTDRWIYSGGIGLDIVTYYDFVIRLEYSLNAEQEYWFVPDVNRGF